MDDDHVRVLALTSLKRVLQFEVNSYHLSRQRELRNASIVKKYW